MSDYHGRFLSPIATDTSSLLGSPDTLYKSAWDMAFPNITAWCAAAAGALLVVMFIKHLRG